MLSINFAKVGGRDQAVSRRPSGPFVAALTGQLVTRIKQSVRSFFIQDFSAAEKAQDVSEQNWQATIEARQAYLVSMRARFKEAPKEDDDLINDQKRDIHHEVLRLRSEFDTLIRNRKNPCISDDFI